LQFFVWMCPDAFLADQVSQYTSLFWKNLHSHRFKRSFASRRRPHFPRPDDDDVVQVSEGMGFHVGSDDTVQVSLKCCWGGMESKRHEFPVVEFTPGHSKRCALSATFRPGDLPISVLEFQRRNE